MDGRDGKGGGGGSPTFTGSHECSKDVLGESPAPMELLRI